jgi:hypothetical protein
LWFFSWQFSVHPDYEHGVPKQSLISTLTLYEWLNYHSWVLISREHDRGICEMEDFLIMFIEKEKNINHHLLITGNYK